MLLLRQARPGNRGKGEGQGGRGKCYRPLWRCMQERDARRSMGEAGRQETRGREGERHGMQGVGGRRQWWWWWPLVGARRECGRPFT